MLVKMPAPAHQIANSGKEQQDQKKLKIFLKKISNCFCSLVSMKVLEDRAKFVTNAEVFCHLSEIQYQNEWNFTIPAKDTSNVKRKHKKFNQNLINLEIATKDVSLYLSKVQPLARHNIELCEELKSQISTNPESASTEAASESEEEDIQKKYVKELYKSSGIRLANLISGLNKYDLMEIEKLMIANSLPKNLVGLCSVVEEFEERFGNDTEDILSLIESCYPEVFEEPEDVMEDIQEEQEEEQEEAEEEEDEEAFEDNNDLLHESRVPKAQTDMEIDEVAES